MNRYMISGLWMVCLMLAGCTNVSKLSDDAEILDFKIKRVSEGVELNTEKIVIKDNEVLIPLEYGRKNFPLTIQTEICFSSTTDETMSADEQELDLEEFVFHDVYETKAFYLIAASGKPHLATVKLVDKLNAEIVDFKVDPEYEHAVSVVILNNNIRILLKKPLGWPLTITPEIHKTPAAEYLDYREGEAFTFASAADNQKQITLRAENGDLRIWNIQVVSPIENSDFELWQGEGAKIDIDPVPGVGLGWATANNNFVQGTKPVVHNGGKAAQMTTELQSIGFLGDMIASGTIFTGRFQLSVSALNDPSAMTSFGIPFVSKPVSVGVEAFYQPGKQLQQSVKEGGVYKLHNLTGVDEGRIWVEVLHWAGEQDKFDYHEKPMKGLTVLGEGELVFDGNDSSVGAWKHYTIPIRYNPVYHNLEATHLAIVMTSSRRGDAFVGAVGSRLTADNVEIKY